MATTSPTTTTTKARDSGSSSPSPIPSSNDSNNNTTYVEAEPSTFRAVVQKLTAVSDDDPHKLPVTLPTRPASKKKLQERRRAPTKLEIMLGPASARFKTAHGHLHHHRQLLSGPGWSKGGDQGLLSPVSTTDGFFYYVSSPSPTTPSPSSWSVGVVVSKEEEEEERAILEKRFYLYPSPRSLNGEPPKLLPLFPLHRPRDSSDSINPSATH